VADDYGVTEEHFHIPSTYPRGGLAPTEGTEMTEGLNDINKMTQSLERGFNK